MCQETARTKEQSIPLQRFHRSLIRFPQIRSVALIHVTLLNDKEVRQQWRLYLDQAGEKIVQSCLGNQRRDSWKAHHAGGLQTLCTSLSANLWSHHYVYLCSATFYLSLSTMLMFPRWPASVVARMWIRKWHVVLVHGFCYQDYFRRLRKCSWITDTFDSLNCVFRFTMFLPSFCLFSVYFA